MRELMRKLAVIAALCAALPLAAQDKPQGAQRSEEHTSELQSQSNLVCRLLLEKKKQHEKRHLVFEGVSNHDLLHQQHRRNYVRGDLVQSVQQPTLDVGRRSRPSRHTYASHSR